MSPITHLLIGWGAANLGGLQRRERAVVALAGLVPDADGLGMVVDFLTRHAAQPTNWWGEYHHTFGHNLFTGLALAFVTFLLASRRFTAAALAFASFHLHLLGDLIGARGPDGDQWPIHYFWPASNEPALTWAGQWPLNAWPNFVTTAVFLALMFWLAWRRGYSPLEMVSARADSAFVAALRIRFPLPERR